MRPEKYFPKFLILLAGILFLYFPVSFADASASKTLKDIKKELSGQEHVSNVGLLEGISFSPPLTDPCFWDQTPLKFKRLNLEGAWEEQEWGKTELQLRAKAPADFTVWQIIPVDITARFSDNRLRWIIINLWNKGDCGLKDYRIMSRLYKMVKERLKECGFEKDVEKQMVSAVVKRTWDTYTIGRTNLGLSFERNEYFFVKLNPAGEDYALVEPSEESLRESLRDNVKREADGDVYISGIPMIEQGGKGYCAPATCTRIMLYYGYEVDMHLLADLMKTERSRGTHRQQIENSLRRLARGSPVSYKRIHLFGLRQIEKYISAGIPLIWNIPGHIRLIIGYNEDTKEIIYSDSWGKWAKERRMPFRKAKGITEDIYVLR